MAKILVVDDERPIRNTLKEILEYEDYAVDVVWDGVQALEFIEKNKYDLVLCDYDMPKMNGIKLLQTINKYKYHLPFLMISGRASTKTAVEAIKMGAVDFIEKPIDLNRLFTAITQTLNLSKAAVNQTITDTASLNNSSVKYLCNESGEQEAVMLPISVWNDLKAKICAQ